MYIYIYIYIYIYTCWKLSNVFVRIIKKDFLTYIKLMKRLLSNTIEFNAALLYISRIVYTKQNKKVVLETYRIDLSNCNYI